MHEIAQMQVKIKVQSIRFFTIVNVMPVALTLFGGPGKAGLSNLDSLQPCLAEKHYKLHQTMRQMNYNTKTSRVGFHPRTGIGANSGALVPQNWSDLFGLVQSWEVISNTSLIFMRYIHTQIRALVIVVEKNSGSRGAPWLAYRAPLAFFLGWWYGNLSLGHSLLGLAQLSG